MNIDDLLEDLTNAAPSVRAMYVNLFDPNVPSIPIPFFGAIESAQVITVGLNPSDGEFRARNWPSSLPPQALRDRLTQYFSSRTVAPHPWFSTWSEALRHIGVSYGAGSAAHVDICPWATKPMSSLPDQNRFTHLVEDSFPWFVRSLQLAAKARLEQPG